MGITPIEKLLLWFNRTKPCPVCKEPGVMNGFCSVEHADEWQDRLAY